MENPTAEFTAELDLTRGSSYGNFISGVRDQLVHHAGAMRHLELVLLPHQESDPGKAPWFGVTLRHGPGDLVLFRIRADSLYLCGYRNYAGQWHEFHGGSAISGATSLSFGESYGEMAAAASTELVKLTLGMDELAADTGTQRETAISMMTMSVMVSEAIRFRSVGRHGVLSAHMVKQVKSSGSLSEYWLGAVPYIKADADAIASQRYDYIPQHLLAPAKIDCQDHAMTALGVALNLQSGLQDKHKVALDKHWRDVHTLARKLDRERASASGT